MKNPIIKFLSIIILLFLFIFVACSYIREYEITHYDDKILNESTDGFFVSSSEFETDDVEFYRYYTDQSSVSNETFIRLTYSTNEQYLERLNVFLKKGKWKKTICTFNEKYDEYFPLPASIISGGKDYLANYSVKNINNEMLAAHLQYNVIAASDQDLTIVFYKGYIIDNIIFKHKPKYFLFLGFEPYQEGDYFIDAGQPVTQSSDSASRSALTD